MIGVCVVLYLISTVHVSADVSKLVLVAVVIAFIIFLLGFFF